MCEQVWQDWVSQKAAEILSWYGKTFSGKIVSEQTAKITNQAEAKEVCPGCGMARHELYSQGQMGCAQCYAAFGAEVQQALKEIHGEIRHLGKNAG